MDAGEIKVKVLLEIINAESNAKKFLDVCEMNLSQKISFV